MPGPSHFDEIYEGRAPWDTGRPQPAIVEAHEQGWLHGDILDVGCGTGENALFLAAHGHTVVGIDVAERAVEIARVKTIERGIDARFLIHDALALQTLGKRFDSVVDSGLFHIFSDADRPRYAKSLAAAVRPGGRVVIVAFSEHEPHWGGPRRVDQDEIRATFKDGWTVERIDPVRFETNMDVPGRAWRAVVRRT